MKTTMMSTLAGLALVFPAAAYAQDREAGLSASARYCMKLEQGYVAAHPATRLSDGTIDLNADCIGNPEGGVSDISLQMQLESMPIPARP